jgi:hypothetical protein
MHERIQHMITMYRDTRSSNPYQAKVVDYSVDLKLMLCHFQFILLAGWLRCFEGDKAT